MAIRDFRNLLCWQLARELKCEVIAFTSQARVRSDFEFCDQIRDAAASATANIAEGFARFRPGDSARFLDYATASLAETIDRLIDAHDRGYLDDRLFRRLLHLAETAARTTNRLLAVKRRQAADQRRKPRRHDPPNQA